MVKRSDKRTISTPRISQEELEAARKFIQTDPIGKRLQAAEHILTLLLKDEFPRLKRFILNSAFDLREISTPSKFAQIVRSNPKMGELLKASKTGGYVRINFEKDCIQFILFYGRGLKGNEAALFSDAFGRIVALTYTSLGLDMTGYQAGIETSDFGAKRKSQDIVGRS